MFDNQQLTRELFDATREKSIVYVECLCLSIFRGEEKDLDCTASLSVACLNSNLQIVELLLKYKEWMRKQLMMH